MTSPPFKGMDPDKTLVGVIEAFVLGDTPRSKMGLEALLHWLERGRLPGEAAEELLGRPPRIFVKAEDVPDGAEFCKRTGETWYRRLSPYSAKHFLRDDRLAEVCGMTDYGNMTSVPPDREVWVQPPDYWEDSDIWCELMQKYGWYPEEEDYP